MFVSSAITPAGFPTSRVPLGNAQCYHGSGGADVIGGSSCSADLNGESYSLTSLFRLRADSRRQHQGASYAHQWLPLSVPSTDISILSLAPGAAGLVRVLYSIADAEHYVPQRVFFCGDGTLAQSVVVLALKYAATSLLGSHPGNRAATALFACHYRPVIVDISRTRRLTALVTSAPPMRLQFCRFCQ
ncbi:hypothetical protein Q4I32_007578 [Leishmania shawi]|uniref:Uncharacterized protein n=1 Tax=Leishmania shawi TaxID=5680 RepID=A0AAW3B6Q6_9TRYP